MGRARAAEAAASKVAAARAQGILVAFQVLVHHLAAAVLSEVGKEVLAAAAKGAV